MLEFYVIPHTNNTNYSIANIRLTVEKPQT